MDCIGIGQEIELGSRGIAMPETARFTMELRFNNAPSTGYAISDGLVHIKSIAQHFTKKALNSLNTATGSLIELATTDEITLSSTMTIIKAMYAFRGGDNEIREFLTNNVYLVPLASEAYKKLQTYFPYSTIFMEVNQDQLVISVGTTESPEEADERLHRFDEDWWIDASINSMGRLCITVEFQ